FSPFSFVYSLGHPRDPHPFPTRRSSDLRRAATPGAERAEGAQRRNLAAPPSPARPFLDGPRIGGPSLSLIEALASALSRRRFRGDRKSTRLNSSHVKISYAVFCLKKKKH